jgi:hypothetical protein
MFRLCLPSQNPPFYHPGDFIHDDHDDHENDDSDKDICSPEDSCRKPDKKTNPLGSGDKFTDDGADDRERNACPNPGENIRGDCRQDDPKSQFQTPHAHESGEVDVLLIHLAHAGIGVKEIQKKGEQKDDAYFGPNADAQPDNKEGRESRTWDAVERDDDGFKNFGKQAATPKRVSERDPGQGTQGKPDQYLLKRDPGVLPKVSRLETRYQGRENTAWAADQEGFYPPTRGDLPKQQKSADDAGAEQRDPQTPYVKTRLLLERGYSLGTANI